jgi:integrase
MATIEWRAGKKGRYAYLNWSDAAGQHRESLGAITPVAAKLALHAKEVELLTGQRILSSAPLIGDLAKAYLEWRASEYPDSQERAAEIINLCVVPDFRYVAADQIQPLQAEKWKADRMKVVSAATAIHELAQFKAMLNWSVRTKLQIVNPIADVKAPQNVVSRPPHWYEMEQLHALYVATKERSAVRAAIWQLMANTGIRSGEARHLKAEQVRDGSLMIHSEPGARTKSRKWREVPMSANAKAATKVLAAETTTEYLLPVMTKHALSMAFSYDRSAAGLGGSAHSLRHSFGTHQAMKGTPIRVLKELMGHASIKTTEKYLHVAETHLKNAIAGFNL